MYGRKNMCNTQRGHKWACQCSAWCLMVCGAGGGGEGVFNVVVTPCNVSDLKIRGYWIRLYRIELKYPPPPRRANYPAPSHHRAKLKIQIF